MYAVGAQEADEQRADRADRVARVLEGAGHGQDARAQAGLEQMYPRVEKPAKRHDV